MPAALLSLIRLISLALVGFALAMLALVIALPVVLGLIIRGVLRRSRLQSGPAPAARDAVIEGEWVVLDPARRDRG